MSIPLNVAEGSGELSPKEKTRFYRIALRSTTECAAIVDVARRLDAIHRRDAAEAKKVLLRMTAMLTALVRRHERP